jgi:FtsH-binding integral membrane protein
LRFADRLANYRREAERKEIQNKKTMKKVQLILSVTLCVFGCVLLVTGFILPPLAEIHHSVLIAFGEILTFAGSLIGIDYKYRYKE